MRLRVMSGLLLTTLLSLPAAAVAQPDQRWSVFANVGWDNSISGNLHDGGVGTVLGLPTVVEARSYDDVYGTGVLWRFGVGYMLSDRSELLGSIAYSNVSADPLQVGNVGGLPLFAQFDDYRNFGFEAGYRQYFGAVNRFRPYVGGSLGFSWLDKINADFTVPDAGVVLADTEFYDTSVALLFGLDGGVMIAVSDQVDLNAQLGFRYTGGMSDIDSLAGTGLEDINDDSGRWALPLTFGVRFRF